MMLKRYIMVVKVGIKCKAFEQCSCHLSSFCLHISVVYGRHWVRLCDLELYLIHLSPIASQFQALDALLQMCGSADVQPHGSSYNRLVTNDEYVSFTVSLCLGPCYLVCSWHNSTCPYCWVSSKFYLPLCEIWTEFCSEVQVALTQVIQYTGLSSYSTSQPSEMEHNYNNRYPTSAFIANL